MQSSLARGIDEKVTQATHKLSRVAANLGLLTLAGVLSFAVLEVGVRLFVDFGAHRPTRIEDVNLETKLSFLPNRTRIYETEEFSITFSTNRYGRRDVEWTPAMFADPENIVIIGDSFVLGNAVEEESSIPAQLQAMKAAAGQPLEVFNFGMPGSSPPEYKLNLEEVLQMGIQAQTILVNIFVGNDFDPRFLPKPQAAKPQEDQAPVESVQTPRSPSLLQRSQLIQFVQWRIAHSPRLVGLMLMLSDLTGTRLYDTPAAYVFFRQQTPEQVEAFNGMLGYVGQMKEICDANGRELRVVIFPNKIQVENREDLKGESYDAEKPNRLTLEYCANLGIRCLDLLPVLSNEYASKGKPLFFPVDRHPNERGYQLAAEAIHAFLADPFQRATP